MGFRLLVSDSKAEASEHLVSAENASSVGQIVEVKDPLGMRKKLTGGHSCFKKFGGDGKGGESKQESVVERQMFRAFYRCFSEGGDHRIRVKDGISGPEMRREGFVTSSGKLW